MHVLVTGAQGFVGQHLARQLLASGDEVTGTVFDSAEQDLPRGAKSVALNVEDRDDVNRVLEQVAPDAIVHLAGLSDVAASWTAMDRYFQVNVLGTENVVRCAAESCRVVFASSAEVYGRVKTDQLPLTEDAPMMPTTPYAMSKAAAERIALEAGAIVARSFNLIGAGQSPRFALPSFAQQLATIQREGTQAVLRVGNLTARRDLVHVQDGVEGYQTLVRNGVRGEVYNIASGRATQIQSALDMLLDASGLQVRLEQDPERMRPSDVPVMCGDPSRLQSLGWQCRRGVEEAVKGLWEGLAGATAAG